MNNSNSSPVTFSVFTFRDRFAIHFQQLNIVLREETLFLSETHQHLQGYTYYLITILGPEFLDAHLNSRYELIWLLLQVNCILDTKGTGGEKNLCIINSFFQKTLLHVFILLHLFVLSQEIVTMLFITYSPYHLTMIPVSYVLHGSIFMIFQLLGFLDVKSTLSKKKL